MNRPLFALILLLASCSISIADEVPTTSAQTPSTVTVNQDRKVPLLTPREVVDWGNGSLGTTTWTQGYSDGFILGVRATLGGLGNFGLTPLRICVPLGTTNGTVGATVRSVLSAVTIPAFGNQDDFGATAAAHVIYALMIRYPC